MPITAQHDGGGGSTKAPGRDAIPSIIGNFQAMIAAKIPYGWGQAGKLADDCSGAINWVFWQAGYSVGGYDGTGHGPSTTSDVTYGENVPLDADHTGLDPGDILLEDYEGANSHVALYVGNGMQDDEPTPGQVAHQVPVDWSHVDDVQRFLDPATGKPLGTGITGSFNGNDTGGDLSAPTDATDDSSVVTDVAGAALGGLTGDLKKAGSYFVAIGAGIALIGVGVYKTVSPGGSSPTKAAKSKLSQINPSGGGGAGESGGAGLEDLAVMA